MWPHSMLSSCLSSSGVVIKGCGWRSTWVGSAPSPHPCWAESSADSLSPSTWVTPTSPRNSSCGSSTAYKVLPTLPVHLFLRTRASLVLSHVRCSELSHVTACDLYCKVDIMWLKDRTGLTVHRKNDQTTPRQQLLLAKWSNVTQSNALRKVNKWTLGFTQIQCVKVKRKLVFFAVTLEYSR